MPLFQHCLLALVGLALFNGALDRPDPPEVRDETEASDKKQKPKPPSEPPPRRAVGGLAGFRCLSSVRFPDYPELDYRVEATYIFPDRSRWRIGPAKPETHHQRNLRFRSGENLWRVDPGAERSVRMQDPERGEALMMFELRRVAMIWPAELKWSGTGTRREAELPGVGTLHADLDAESGRPVRIEGRLEAETNFESLEDIEWRQDGKRFWPRSWKLHVGGSLQWTEVIDEVDLRMRLLDSFFVPADRRVASGGVVPIESQRVDLPPRIVWRTELPQDAGWDSALKRAEEERRRWDAKLSAGGLSVDSKPAFRLDPKAKPMELELRLSSLPEELPDGWQRSEAGQALAVMLPRVGAVTSLQLARMNEEIPPGRIALRPYALVQRRPDGGEMVQIVLPHVASE